MTRVKRLLSMVLVAVFTLMICLSNTPASAAAKKTTTKSPAVPKVRFVNQPQSEYTAGDMVKFNLDSAGYAGKVQYRVILWNDETKSYKDLWTVGDRYYTNWKPSGGTLFNLHWMINEPGHYRITILAKRADLPNSKTALKGQNCDSYIAGVPFVVKAKDTTVLLNKEGTTYGSADISKPVSVKGDVKVVAKAVTYKNASVEGNLYISADNAILTNVSVTGTIFVDPGKDGNATLDNVAANEIKVLSGGENSIHLKSVNAKNLVVGSSSKVRVESTGTTKIGNTTVSSYAILDTKTGSLGTILVTTTESGKIEVELRGTFTEPIKVEANATIKAAAEANVAKLEIAPKQGGTVELQGTFKSVEVTKEAKLEIAADAKITELLKVTAKAEIKADAKSEVAKVELAPSSKNETITLQGTFKVVEVTKEATIAVAANTVIDKIQGNASSKVTLGEGAKVIEFTDTTGNKTDITTPPVTPPASGGGGGGGTGSDTTAPSITKFNGNTVSTNTITEAFTDLTKNSTIEVSENSNVSFTINGLDTTFSGLTLNSGSNNIVNLPLSFITSNNLSEVDFGALLDSAKGLDVSSRDELIKNVNFTALINATKGVNSTVKNDIFTTVTSTMTAVADDDKVNELDVLAAIYSDELKNAIPQTEKEKIMKFILGQDGVTFGDINFTAVLNSLKAQDDATKSAILSKINFTALVSAIQGADPATKTLFYNNLTSVMSELDTAGIRSQVVDAMNLGSLGKQTLFNLLDGLDSTAGITITVSLKDSSNNSKTYTIVLTGSNFQFN